MPFSQEEDSWTRKQEEHVPYASPPYAEYPSQSPADVRQPEEVPALSSLQHSSSTPFEMQATSFQYPSYPPPSTPHYPSYPPPPSWPPWETYSSFPQSIPHQHSPPSQPMESYRYPGVYPYPHPHPMYSPPQPLPIPRQQLHSPPLNNNHPYCFERTSSQQQLYSPHPQQQQQHHSEQAVTSSLHHPPSFVYLPSNPQHDNLLVYDIRDEDVLCGRGAPNHLHAGNVFFRRLVDQHKSEYMVSRRSDKPLIATKIVELVRQRGGRFLTRTKVNRSGPAGHFCWKDIGEQRAYEKACQALRENAPEIRKQLAAKRNKQQLAAISIDGSDSQIGDCYATAAAAGASFAAASPSLQAKGEP